MSGLKSTGAGTMNTTDLHELLLTNPHEYKHCTLKLVRPDLAYARPLHKSDQVIRISGADNLKRSLPGDEVCVQILSREPNLEEDDLLTGRVVGLLNRHKDSRTFLCRLSVNNQQLVTPMRKNMPQIKLYQKTPNTIEIRRFNKLCKLWIQDKHINITEDQLLMVKVLKWEDHYKYPLGVVTKVVPQDECWEQMLAVEFGVTDTPPEIQESQKQSKMAQDAGRINLCNVTTITIDDEYAQDLDDAVSMEDKEDGYEIGIHITDVASFVEKNSKEDEFARQQGQTHYHPSDEKKSTAFMFSRSLSQRYLSLIPQVDDHRNAISVITITDKNFTIKDSYVRLTIIKSDKRLSYNDADKIIQEVCLDDKEPQNLVEKCLGVVYRFTEVHRRCRLGGGWSSGQIKGESRAHCMVEELMNLYNSQVAEKLLESKLTQDLTPLKCHMKPKSELFENFKSQYSHLLPFSLHLSNVCDVEDAPQDKEQQQYIEVITPIFKHMEHLAKNGKYHNLLYIFLSDDIHPTLHPMAKQFKEIQEKAHVLRSCSSWSSRLGHFGLQLNAYTSASSPMRRYLDLIVQRLLHVSLGNKLISEYEKNDIEEFCEYGMENYNCTEYYDLDDRVEFLDKTDSGSRVVTKLAFVEKPEWHEFKISLLLDRGPTIPVLYRNLKVVEQPQFDEETESMTLCWKRRVYSFSSNKTWTTKPSKNVVSVSAKIWKEMISAVKAEDWPEVRRCLEQAREEVDKKPHTESSGKCPDHYKDWTLTLKFGEVLEVQPGTEVLNGVNIPVVNLLNIDQSIQVCVEHARNRIKCFAKVHDDCEASKTLYRDVKQYQQIWSKLCKMYTAYNAVEENNSIILEDVAITWTSRENLSGYFQMTQTQKKDWCLEFDLSNCFLCIRLKLEPDKVPEKTGQDESHSYDLLELQRALPFTWVAHGVPMMSAKEKINKNQEQSIIKIHFQVNDRNMEDVPPAVYKKDMKFTVEVIPKKIPYMLCENAVANLKRANDLVKSIAIGNPPPKNLINVNKLSQLKTIPGLPPLNNSQTKAVQEALQNPFTVIQGPPGTGKTVVGVHITNHFYMKNQQAEKVRLVSPSSSENEMEPKKYGILYCGPSNKSVDIVAEQLLKVKSDLKPLRIYCDQTEMMSFPYPGSDLKLCRKTFRDELKVELKDITLMYLVRNHDNSWSENISDFEENRVEFDIKRYRKVLRQAQEEVLRKHDVILCTCSTALKPILRDVMDFKQIIIDECAMATEPEAFIPLVSHNPEQIVLLGDHKQTRPIVSCARVKELGMERSLFERYMGQAVMLDTQYRMHETICQFPSQMFYEDRLQTGTKERPCYLLTVHNTPTAILFAHVQGDENSLVVSTKEGNENSVANRKEAEQAVRVAEILIMESRVKPEDIAILTPYNTQISTIKKILEERKKKVRGIEGINVCTIMKSQGSEWLYVIISTVRSCPLEEIYTSTDRRMMRKRLGFVTDPNLVNVAITRAQQGLCILGNRHLLEFSDLWKNLIKHYQEQNCVLGSAEEIRVKKHKK